MSEDKFHLIDKRAKENLKNFFVLIWWESAQYNYKQIINQSSTWLNQKYSATSFQTTKIHWEKLEKCNYE